MCNKLHFENFDRNLRLGDLKFKMFLAPMRVVIQEGGIGFRFSVQILGLQFEPKSWAQNLGSIFGIFNTSYKVHILFLILAIKLLTTQ